MKLRDYTGRVERAQLMQNVARFADSQAGTFRHSCNTANLRAFAQMALTEEYPNAW